MTPLQTSADKGQTGPVGRTETSLPQVFGRYLLVQRLSRGGMGEIFLAKHGLAGFEKLAVIKKVLPHLAADQQFISRFVDEAQVAIKLQHVNIAAVFEVGRVGNEYFLALEYVEGRDLRRTLSVLNQKKQRLPVDLGLFVGRELANGLAYAHRRTSAEKRKNCRGGNSDASNGSAVDIGYRPEARRRVLPEAHAGKILWRTSE